VRPAKAVRGVNRTLAMAIGKSRADRHGTPFDRWYHEGNLVDCQPGWVSIPALARAAGVALEFTGPKQIMHEITEEFSAFAGATYEAMGDLGVRLSEIAEEV
jgi:NADH-quinone oxidoreductase subunit G